mgnify:FL=1|jgi:long-subunit fatty acid transport protein
MKKSLVLVICLLTAITAVYSQNEIDALRYSRLSPTGTARFTAMGGAFGALGADFSSLSSNPAGIGLYTRSEFSITPSLYVGSSESRYMGDIREDEKYNFNLGNIGIVLIQDLTMRNPSSQWKKVQFGFGMNRMANFHNRVLISGFNETSSYLTPIVDASQGVALDDLDNFGAGLAYDTELMWNDANGVYYIDMPNGGVMQRKSIESSGAINEMVFSFGANYNDQVYLGATLGVPYISYKETSIYTETDTENRSDYFDSFTRIDELETSGTGINLKVGIIVRPTDFIRLGGAIETPTFYSMSDDFSTSFRSRFDTASSKRASATGYYDYELNTPFKAMAGVGIILGKSGLISADYQYLNYSNARLRADDYDFEGENDAIRESYNVAHNLRFGAEWRLGLLSLRGGYAISANPYKEGTNSVMNTYSAGLGVRGSRVFADLTWAMNDMDDEYHLYSTPFNADPPVADTQITNSMFLLTLGFRF